MSIKQLIDYSKKISKVTEQFFINWFSDDDYIEVQTSGSTGKPKTIQLKKEFMKNSALATGEFFVLKENTSALLCMPTEFIAGKMMLLRALLLGWHIDVIKPSSKPLIVVDKNYDFSAMVPMQLQNSLDKIHKIKKLIVGGGEVSRDLENQIQSISTEIFATFGMTETITHIAVKKLNHFNNVTLSETEKFHYKILPNVSISQDGRNCLVINAPKISNQKIVTNDVVKIVSETEFKWLGRYDNVINSGGIKLHPEVIEKKLSRIIKQRFFVTGVFDKELGEKLILIVEGKETNITFREVKSLSKYEIPKKVYFLNQFIETETKKIQRSKTVQLIKV